MLDLMHVMQWVRVNSPTGKLANWKLANGFRYTWKLANRETRQLETRQRISIHWKLDKKESRLGNTSSSHLLSKMKTTPNPNPKRNPNLTLNHKHNLTLTHPMGA